MEVPNSYGKLNKMLQTLSEKDCAELLMMEMYGKRRPVWLERIHQRFSKLRMERERRELMKISAQEVMRRDYLRRTS